MNAVKKIFTRDFTRKVTQYRDAPGGASLYDEKSVQICVNRRSDAFLGYK